MSRRLLIYLVPSVPLLIATGIFWYVAEYDSRGAWEALGSFIIALGLGALWLLYSVVFALVVAFQAGYRRSVYGTLGALSLSGLVWLGIELHGQNQCQAGSDAINSLTKQNLVDRRENIRGQAEIIARNHDCARQALASLFVHHADTDPPESPGQRSARLETWRLLIEVGLKPQDYFIHGIIGADAVLIDLLIPKLPDRFPVRRVADHQDRSKPQFLTDMAFSAIDQHRRHYDPISRQNSTRIIKSLLTAGAGLDLKNKSGKTLREKLEALKLEGVR